MTQPKWSQHSKLSSSSMNASAVLVGYAKGLPSCRPFGVLSHHPSFLPAPLSSANHPSFRMWSFLAAAAVARPGDSGILENVSQSTLSSSARKT